MMTTVYRFTFARSDDLADAEGTLHLALFSAEGLFGPARVRLDAGYSLESDPSAILVDASTEVGGVVARIFTGLLLREMGEDAFEVRVTGPEGPAVTTQKAA